MILRFMVVFAARLWYLLEKFTGLVPLDYTTAFKDSRHEKYRTDLKSFLRRLKSQRPIDNEYRLKERDLVRASMNGLISVRDRVLHSSARGRILPDGSDRLRIAKAAWRRTFGRIPFLKT